VDAEPAPVISAPGGAFTPKLVTVFAEGYRLPDLRADILAGLTVAVVALPLSMAIAVASGTTPDRGLVTAIVGGFLVSALSGSRFQIGGPAGAFIVLVAACIARHGIDGAVLATGLSGLMLIAAGLLRLGSLIRLIPAPVTVGFTAGIGGIILLSQLKDALGLHLAVAEPGPVIAKLQALSAAAGTVSVSSIALCAATVVTILFLRATRPAWPGMLIAIALAAMMAAAGLPVETLAERFGAFPTSLPMPVVPTLSWAKVLEMLPDAAAFALLGAIESLLCAVVADGMTRRRHRSNCELVAQGVANLGSALFGGISVTGTVARTATNVRAGAHSPVAGMVHSLALLLILMVAGPLCGYIPLPALAGVLIVVAWNMLERHALAHYFSTSRSAFAVAVLTLGLTLFAGLIEAIAAGSVLSLVLGRRARRS
jgi:sulfate permease, SulP family